MSSGTRGPRLVASVVAAGALGALVPSPAAAEDPPGPAFVDELSSQLQPLRDDGPGDPARARRSGLSVEDGRVLVDVYVQADPADAAQELASLGMEVSATASDPRPVVEGYLPLGSLAEVARLRGATALVSPAGGGTDAGSETSQGVAAHQIPAALEAGAGDGTGVEVGVISDSINRVGGGVAASQASGDLPPAPRVVILDEDTSPGTVDEGRAMAEIVYDEAPGVDRILFATGTEAGPVAKAASIDALVANGADVIADDIFRLDEPFFQDGVVAQAVDRAKAADVAYFASAGNRARQSYESGYRDSGGFHDFDPGPATDTRSCFSNLMPTGAGMALALDWDEPVGRVATDIDIQITDSVGTVLAASAADSIVNGSPKEIVFYENSGLPFIPCVEIVRAAGSGSPFMKWIENDDYNRGVPQFDTRSDTINPDAASARGALAVAAVDAFDPGLNTPETFSSRGPKIRIFDAGGNRFPEPLVLAKPELAAADGVSTTVDGFSPFFGTSAAVPSAAGVATILRSTNPRATVTEIYAQMTDPANAIPCTSPNAAADCGAGFILADRAAAALDRNGPKVKAVTKPRRPNARGWFTTRRVSVRWRVSDPDSPIESKPCPRATIKKEGKRRLKCRALSGGGARSGRVRIRHDSTPPAKPRVRGIRAGASYDAADLPSARLVERCISRDATSGLRSCRVSGYGSSRGVHVLRATAVDRAGLTARLSVRYRVR